MITTLTATSTERIVSELLDAEGTMGGSRVLTLLISTSAQDLEEALTAAHGASLDHPSRIIAVVHPDDDTESATRPGSLDAEIRVGHDAGAGETLVLRPHGAAAAHPETLVVPFLLPDVPVVTWWPTTLPEQAATDPLGRLACTRITNTPAQPDPAAALDTLAPSHTRGDIDLAWTRMTLWRAIVASTLGPVLREHEVHSVTVAGERANASLSLMLHWLRLRLGVAVERVDVEGFSGIAQVAVHTGAGTWSIERADQERVRICTPDGAHTQIVTMPRRQPVTTLNEELRRLSPDVVYEEVLAALAADHRASGA